MAAIPTPSCPRCGYDQTGVIEAWRESCPLTGVCSECGLAFEWVWVLLPGRFSIPWFVEHSRGGWAMFRAAWATWWRVIRPNRFFSRVTLEHAPRPRRIAAWLALVTLPAVVLGAVIHEVLFAFFVAPHVPPSLTGWWDYADSALRPFVVFYPTITPAGAITGHTARIWLCGWPWFVYFLFGMAPAWPLVLLVLPATRARAKVRMVHLFRLFTYGLWWLGLLAVLRVLRGLSLLAVAGSGAIKPYELMEEWSLNPLTGRWGLLWLGGLAAWTAWWWYCAIVGHMRLQNGRRVWALVLVISLMTGALVLALPAAIGLGR